MAKNNKYQTNIEKIGSSWQAQITRQVTSKKITVTKQQGDFATKKEANAWADKELKELLATLVSSNKRHGKNRQQSAEITEQRSARRAEKTAQAKAEKIANAKKTVAQEAKAQQPVNDVLDGLDSEVDYDFDEYSEAE